ncbi:ABC transporter ATP-binding protein [Polymorphospora rubra]|uniref:ABC transporter ATP-binding protein n=1 Tax=Polymorphospora rubra TaxID=338584 RepID=A0A810N3P7_9ACTN|nr:ABC transporter ATP-binding protein [Polymorphospora rubra]BCJ68321.1 ABC transporter ATP-binding protein [Polymorphospora rubra]
MLTVERMRAGYGRTGVVWDADLTVHKGEAVALIGPNGAGKSTVLKAICGLLRPTSGSVVFEGTPIHGMSCNRIVGRGLAYVPERMKLFPAMTVEENLLLGAWSRRARADRRKNLESIYELLPRLVPLARRPAHVLSGGEQQAVALGRGLMSRPNLLLSDEPLLGLDPSAVDSIKELFVRIRERGVTILFIEQNVEHALDMADRVYVLESGAVAAHGPVAEMRKHPLMREVYLGA